MAAAAPTSWTWATLRHASLRWHARVGTTALLATTTTSPVEEIEAALSAAERAAGNQGVDEAAILGVHLEGPFISADKLGAQLDFVIQATSPLWSG